MLEILIAFLIGVGAGASAFYVYGPPLPLPKYRFVSQKALVNKVSESQVKMMEEIFPQSAIFKLTQKLRIQEPESSIPSPEDKFWEDFKKDKTKEINLIIQKVVAENRTQATSNFEKFELYCEALWLEKSAGDVNTPSSKSSSIRLVSAAQTELEKLAERYYLDHKSSSPQATPPN